MAVKIRLRRAGAKKKPFYRIVVADSRSPRDGRCVEEIGYYNPLTKDLKLDGEKIVGEERMLQDLKERIRDVRQGPDGFIYILTDSRNGRILRLEPNN